MALTRPPGVTPRPPAETDDTEELEPALAASKQSIEVDGFEVTDIEDDEAAPALGAHQVETLTLLFQEYARTRHLREQTAKQEDKFKAQLMAAIAEVVDPDEAGHRRLRFPEPVEVGGRVYTAAKRERRVSTKLNVEAAQEWLDAHGLLGECIVNEPRFDEDKLLALNFEGRVPDAVFKTFYEDSETFAFVPEKE